MDFFKKLFSGSQKDFNPAIFSFFSPKDIPRMNSKEYLKAYHGWVFACVNAISERVADIDLKLQQKQKDGTWKDIPTHPALDLIRKVNDFTTFYDLIYGTQAYLELDGNAFWYIPRNGNQAPSEIWQLDPTRVAVVKSKTEYVSGYILTTETGTQVPFEIEEIIHFKRFNPLNPLRGMGTVQAADIEIDINKYASEWQRNFFGNSAMPSGVLSTEGTLNQDQYDRIKMNWDSKFKGTPNAHKMALLEGGLKWQSMSPTSREMEFTNSRKDTRDTILAIFRVAKTILGITEDVNYASAQATEYVFSKYTIKPKVKFLVSKLDEFYLPLFKLDSAQYRLFYSDPVPENIEQNLEIINSGRQNGWLSKNEARARFGYDPREGADDLDQPPMETDLPGTDQPDDPQHTEENNEERDDEEEHEKSVKKNVKKLIKKIDESYKNEQIAKFKKTYLNLNKKLETQVLDNLKNEKLVTPYEQKTFLERLKDVADPSDDLVRILFTNFNDWIGLVFNASHAGMKAILEKSGKEAMAQVNVDASFDLENPRAVDWLNTHAMEDSTSYSDTIKEEISLQVQQGVENGASREQIANSISQYFTETDDYRAERIARTETINAYSAGNLQAYRQSEVVVGKIWVPDAEACDICVENGDAGEIGLEDDFPSGDSEPTAHPSCECDLQPVVDGEE